MLAEIRSKVKAVSLHAQSVQACSSLQKQNHSAVVNLQTKLMGLGVGALTGHRDGIPLSMSAESPGMDPLQGGVGSLYYL